MGEKNVIITIQGEGVNVVQETTLKKAGQIISFLAIEQEISMASSSVSTLPHTLIPKQTLKELIMDSKAKTYAQKITVAAMYLRDSNNQETFSSQEIKNLLRKMGDEPKNFQRDLSSAEEYQYIIKNDLDGDRYELTAKGEEEVKTGFQNEPVRKQGVSKRVVSLKGVRDEIKNLEVGGVLENFPDYFNLSTKGDKILWLLAYAEEKGVNTLTPSEVEHLSGKLREKIILKGFTALNARNIKRGYVIQNKEGFQIQKRGLDYLKTVNNQLGNVVE